MKPRVPRIVLRAAFAAALFGCIGTETENPEVKPNLQGRLADTTGKPVPGASIWAVPSGGTAPTDSSRSDAQGGYFFRRLPPGSYNLIGQARNGALGVLIPEVELTRLDSTLDLGVAVLEPPGHILGQALFQGNPIAGIPCYLQGTSFQAISDTAGRVLFANIPRGVFTLSYYGQSIGLGNAHDTVAVRPGNVSVLPPKNVPPAF